MKKYQHHYYRSYGCLNMYVCCTGVVIDGTRAFSTMNLLMSICVFDAVSQTIRMWLRFLFLVSVFCCRIDKNLFLIICLRLILNADASCPLLISLGSIKNIVIAFMLRAFACIVFNHSLQSLWNTPWILCEIFEQICATHREFWNVWIYTSNKFVSHTVFSFDA